jgi:hypothetical protein
LQKIFRNKTQRKKSAAKNAEKTTWGTLLNASSSETFWYVLVCFEMFWYVLRCFGMFRDFLGDQLQPIQTPFQESNPFHKGKKFASSKRKPYV